MRADILQHADVALADIKGALLCLCETIIGLCLAESSASVSYYSINNVSLIISVFNVMAE